MGFYVLGLIDAAGKRTHATVRTGPINEATYLEVTGQAADYLAAVQSVILGHVTHEELQVYRNLVNNTKATNSAARKIVRWRVTWVDNTPFLDPPDNTIPNPTYGKIFTDHILTADPTKTITGSNNTSLTTSPWPALVTAFQALARSKSNGQPLIKSIILLDR